MIHKKILDGRRCLSSLTLTELMRALQDFGIFIVIILLAYVVYRIAILVEVMSKKIQGEKNEA